MLKDKAVIIIAVSKYAGTYDNLPGAITSARRLREWAEQSDEDCKYKVLYLADDVFEKIDVQLVREQVSQFVNSNFIDRLIVYFAGHGIVRSAGDQFWLLTNAAQDLREGIDVEAFRRGLLKCNIGNADFAGQLCIIGDACRNTGRDAIEFYGDPILTSTAKRNSRIQLDKFLSTGLGNYSFQINQIGSQSAYCLFSEVMLSALRGEVKEAIDTEDHRFKPVITNHKLAEYLEKEVRSRAAAIGEEMEPDLLTGIHPPHNFYKRLKEPISDVIASSQDSQLAAAIQMAIHDPHPESSNEKLTAAQEGRKQTLLGLKDRIKLNYSRLSIRVRRRFDPNNPNFLTVSDFRPNFIAVPRSATVEVAHREETLYEILAFNCYDSPILIHQDGQWIIIPNYLNVVAVISRNLPGDILFFKTGHFTKRDEVWDTYLSDFSNLAGSVPLRAAEAKKFADRVRVGKEEYPHQAVTAGYLYEFSNDYDNIARTAHYMARNTDSVPFDLALLCADKIWWSKENGRLVAFADLPAVEPSQPSEQKDNRPYYARREFAAHKNVQLWGITPIFRQGWSFMQTELYLDIPDKIRLISENMIGRSAASLTDEGLRMFLKAFDYRVIEIDT
ncbi:caspase family protein [Leptolyngbya sp. FACHB-541]|nr:caspase family protein [Leptolyngbya sp. FACHB-541]MBD1995226.1 caspase family protein [Leptolyngbya sp. FACHB-541]